MSTARLRHRRRLPLLAVLVPLAGCMSMSGLGGSSKYACGAPQGVACDSVSGTYANAVHHTLPSQRRGALATEPAAVANLPARAAVPTTGTASPETPLRAAPRILRLWFKPWQDADDDLYDQGYVYVRIDDGQWLIEHAQRAIRDQYAPVRPPASPAAVPDASPAAPAPQPPPYPPIDLPDGERR